MKILCEMLSRSKWQLHGMLFLTKKTETKEIIFVLYENFYAILKILSTFRKEDFKKYTDNNNYYLLL